MSSPEVRATLVGGSEDVAVSLSLLQVEEGRTLAVLGSVGAANRNSVPSRIRVGPAVDPVDRFWIRELEIKVTNKPGMITHAFNRKIEVEIRICSQPGLHNKTCFVLFLRKIKGQLAPLRFPHSTSEFS